MSRKSPPDKSCNCDLTRDISLASGIQQLLLPRSSPLCDWCCIGVKNQMAAGLGGDYFDFIRMPDGCQTLFIGDATGHGLSASVVMSLVYGFIHRASLEECAPLSTVRDINLFLRSFARRSAKLDHLFSTTLFLAIIDPRSLHMHYVNCGHVQPLIRRNRQLIRLETTAPPLGFFGEPEIELGTFEFRKGDRMLLYTDGISEGVNGAGEQFGRARVEAVLSDSKGDHLEFLEQFYGAIRDFGSPFPPLDDCTAIVLDLHNPLPGAPR